MKKWTIVFACLGLVVLLTSLGAYHQREALFNAAIKFEKDRAGLLDKDIEVDDLTISLLHRPSMTAQSNAASDGPSSQAGSAQGIATDAETIVLIHGFAASKENWLRFAANIPASYQLIIPDLPGHGESSKETDRNYSVESQVQHLQNILNALNLEAVHLAGNSMGGAIATMYTSRYPSRVDSLTLINPAGVFDHLAPQQILAEQGENPLVVESEEDFADLLTFAMEKPPFIPWPISKVVAAKSIAKKDINHKIYADLTRYDPESFKVALAKVSVPTLVLWGREDRIIDVRNSDVFGRLIPGAEVKIYEHIGHAPMIEIPAISASDMVAHLPE